MQYLALNQYRQGSSYKDEVGIVYHFPKRYLKRIQAPNSHFVYYEPRAGGDQVYFGTGYIGEIWPDQDDQGHYYSEILEYDPFPKPVSYWGFRGSAFEPSRTMRNSVRPIHKTTYDAILHAAGFNTEYPILSTEGFSQLEQLYADAKPELQRYLAERYERPSRITKLIKKTRGATCQICGYEGFRMRNGKTYCEIHHLFHVAKRLPGSLAPNYLIVVCAVCHRKLHYACATDPKELNGNWVFQLDGLDVSISLPSSS
jgi:hypothetical protein